MQNRIIYKVTVLGLENTTVPLQWREFECTANGLEWCLQRLWGYLRPLSMYPTPKILMELPAFRCVWARYMYEKGIKIKLQIINNFSPNPKWK